MTNKLGEGYMDLEDIVVVGMEIAGKECYDDLVGAERTENHLGLFLDSNAATVIDSSSGTETKDEISGTPEIFGNALLQRLVERSDHSQ